MRELQYWGLTDKPFEEVCDTRFFFENSDHREALDRMLYVVNDHNMNIGLLTGEIGSGKTLTRNVFVNSLPLHQFEAVVFDNSSFSYSDILYDIVKSISFRDPRVALVSNLEEPIRGDKYQLTMLLRQKLDILAYQEHRHLVVVFDEAQLMESPVLDELKGLTNIKSETGSLVTIFLTGQPELRESIRALRQVDQRIFLRYHLNNLDFPSTINYMNHRLRVAGLSRGSMFSNSAAESIFRTTAGVPREINRICKLLLSYGFAHTIKEITADDVKVILDDLESC